jgi:hypothetical protein
MTDGRWENAEKLKAERLKAEGMAWWRKGRS